MNTNFKKAALILAIGFACNSQAADVSMSAQASASASTNSNMSTSSTNGQSQQGSTSASTNAEANAEFNASSGGQSQPNRPGQGGAPEREEDFNDASEDESEDGSEDESEEDNNASSETSLASNVLVAAQSAQKIVAAQKLTALEPVKLNGVTNLTGQTAGQAAGQVSGNLTNSLEGRLLSSNDLSADQDETNAIEQPDAPEMPAEPTPDNAKTDIFSGAITSLDTSVTSDLIASGEAVIEGVSTTQSIVSQSTVAASQTGNSTLEMAETESAESGESAEQGAEVVGQLNAVVDSSLQQATSVDLSKNLALIDDLSGNVEQAVDSQVAANVQQALSAGVDAAVADQVSSSVEAAVATAVEAATETSILNSISL
jgi:hypothetical protein